MPARKMRIELFDNEGNRYTISFEGRVTREKALRLLDLVELLGGVPGEERTSEVSTRTGELSKYAKVHLIIRKHFPLIWFASKEVQSVYEHELKEPICLSTIATYLSRMVDRRILVKMRGSRHLKYRMTQALPMPTIKRRMPS
jgi:hypothetical protein